MFTWTTFLFPPFSLCQEILKDFTPPLQAFRWKDIIRFIFSRRRNIWRNNVTWYKNRNWYEFSLYIKDCVKFCVCLSGVTSWIKVWYGNMKWVMVLFWFYFAILFLRTKFNINRLEFWICTLFSWFTNTQKNIAVIGCENAHIIIGRWRIYLYVRGPK